MIKLEMKNYGMLLIERLKKYQRYHQAKLKSMNILTGEKILASNQKQIIEQAKFTYSPLWKAFEKQTKEQVQAVKDLNVFYKKNELKWIENIFPQNILDDMISNK